MGCEGFAVWEKDIRRQRLGGCLYRMVETWRYFSGCGHLQPVNVHQTANYLRQRLDLTTTT